MRGILDTVSRTSCRESVVRRVAVRGGLCAGDHGAPGGVRAFGVADDAGAKFPGKIRSPEHAPLSQETINSTFSTNPENDRETEAEPLKLSIYSMPHREPPYQGKFTVFDVELFSAGVVPQFLAAGERPPI